MSIQTAPSINPTVSGVEALLAGETGGFAADFTELVEARRVGVRASGVLTRYAPDDFFSNGGTSPKRIFDVAGTLVWSPHNMFLQSQTFDNASWTKGANTTITANDTTAPDGTVTADKISVSSAVTSNQGVSQNVAALTSASYATRHYLKYIDVQWIKVTLDTGIEVWFDILNGSVGTQSGGAVGTIAAAANGFYELKVTHVQADTTAGLAVRLVSADNVATAIVGSAHIWGAQINRGTVPTTYLATTTAARYGLAVDYDPTTHGALGLLVEPAATNLALWASDFTNAAWDKTGGGGITAAKTATGPDGVANSASTLTASGANGTALQSITSASAARISSCFVKRRTGTGTINMTQDNGSTWTDITASINSSTWTRVSIPSATVTNPVVGFRIVTSGDEIDVFIFQQETGTVVTSPVQTFGVTVTRAEDLPNFALSTIPFSATEGTLIAEFTCRAITGAGALNFVVSVDDNTDGNRISYSVTSTQYSTTVLVASAGQASFNAVTHTVAQKTRGAGAWKANDFVGIVNAGSIVADTSGTIPTVTTMRVGSQRTTSRSLNGYFHKLTYAPRRMSNGELQTRTAT